ncbi:Crp/Fnr family transcriptional regulator [Magnetospirillum molischianum]|uniref:cAMP-binding protein-catabolite gene activator and regulatory subunit of cAMP-dependent protein kinase n=1 Tax=Magnetospirillum molischianum DSM 120 TaxID=1150626 RepID=H8FRS9_MAGML|nr:Crp/Fnr family transcriptional regulator [Magnetospirillum molischianum]CCG41067.1 cAMP-binding protein-catabolite gene activator and regulatory subunit of cAMP-dependent protein kinase [Magnetospirillum molischianum DSM 120]
MNESVIRRREMLSLTPLFSAVPASLLDELAAKARTIRVSAREQLFSKGDPGDRLYLVIAGVIRISTLSPEGREVTYGLIKAGELFGEIAVLDGGRRSADATALEPSELLTLDRRDVIDFLDRHPALALHLLRVLCERLRRADDLLEDVVFLSLPGRLAKHLLVLAGTLSSREVPEAAPTIRLSQQELADHLGISRESVNKVLSKWEQAEMVTLGRSQITLNCLDALGNLAQPSS